MTSSIEHIFFFGLLALATLAFFGVINAFIVPLFWATALAILFEPLNDRMAAAIGGRGGFASLLTILLILLALVLPLMLLGLVVTEEVVRLIEAIEDGSIDPGAVVRWGRESAPLLFDYAARVGIEPDGLKEKLSGAALSSGQWIASHALNLGQNALRFMVMLLLTFYLLFFFLRDGHANVERLIQILPLGDARERQLFDRFAAVVRATVKGTFVIAAIQGLIGGITFALLDIRAATLWGVVMAMLSLLPAVGAALIWVPAAGMLIAGGDWVSALILIGVGIFVIGLADNLLRPILVGRDTQMPDYLILLATLGGLALFGISGMVIGPLIAALFITLWEMFEQSYGDRDQELLRDQELVSQDVAAATNEATDDPAVEVDEPPSATS
ncbi:MAG: AI-2E family transporter [Pseudomonadales bacterium]